MRVEQLSCLVLFFVLLFVCLFDEKILFFSFIFLQFFSMVSFPITINKNTLSKFLKPQMWIWEMIASDSAREEEIIKHNYKQCDFFQQPLRILVGENMLHAAHNVRLALDFANHGGHSCRRAHKAFQFLVH